MSKALTTTIRCLFTVFTRAPDHASHTLLYHLDVELPIAGHVVLRLFGADYGKV